MAVVGTTKSPEIRDACHSCRCHHCGVIGIVWVDCADLPDLDYVSGVEASCPELKMMEEGSQVVDGLDS